MVKMGTFCPWSKDTKFERQAKPYSGLLGFILAMPFLAGSFCEDRKELFYSLLQTYWSFCENKTKHRKARRKQTSLSRNQDWPI